MNQDHDLEVHEEQRIAHSSKFRTGEVLIDDDADGGESDINSDYTNTDSESDYPDDESDYPDDERDTNEAVRFCQCIL